MNCYLGVEMLFHMRFFKISVVILNLDYSAILLKLVC